MKEGEIFIYYSCVCEGYGIQVSLETSHKH